ncbi:MAG TPA: hypothetical protein PL131_13050 [Methylotenera sp.]|jgi:hypothetical protein|nr:MAG: hypothetical protein CTY14_03460 [Methylotenera sp.]PPD54800.1 MAG: hypothetical protein CTY12_02415 [Methylotenera sp.]HPH06791.1 hypothetical protein [Methylotenera sp.]
MKVVSTLIAVMSMYLFSILAQAHGDEDHGAAPVAIAVGGAPRIAVYSDLFELVGIVENGAMTLYLDRYVDNAPVTDANIEVETGSEKLIATANPDGTYRVVAKAFAKPTEIPVTFTITAGNDSDLLAGDLVVADAHADDSHVAVSPFANKWLIGGLTVLAILVLIARFAIRQRRRQKVGMFK